jgi:hypothetical protein
VRGQNAPSAMHKRDLRVLDLALPAPTPQLFNGFYEVKQAGRRARVPEGQETAMRVAG